MCGCSCQVPSLCSAAGPNFNGGSATDRGADTAEEFARQRAKIIAAIATISPDVAGLTEIENDGYGPTSAIQASAAVWDRPMSGLRHPP